MSAADDPPEIPRPSDENAAESLPAHELELVRAVLDTLPDHVYVKDRAGRYVFVNDVGLHERKLAGLPEIVGKTVYEIVPRELAEKMTAEDRQVMETGQALVNRESTTAFAGAAPHPEGRRWHLTTKIPLRDAAGRIVGIVGINRDISDRKLAELALQESEERFRHLAHYDALTSLPNRALFYDRLRQALAQAARQRWTLGIMLVDLDRFKEVNDTLGHAAGDLLLNQVGARLLAALRRGDTAARLGGDEFAVVLTTVGAPGDAGVVASKIVARLAEPFILEGREARIGASIGIALYPQDGADADDLVKSADAAMYQAKEAGRNCYRFSRGELNERALEVAGSESDLRRALARGELVLHYQPQLALATGALAGAEALVRWAHPERGLLPAASFLPFVEGGSLVRELGEWVLESACAQLRALRRAKLGDIALSVNLFPRQLVRRDLGSVLSRLAGVYGVEARLLELEVTEAALAADPGSAALALEELQALGVKCWVDDFGTGFSSLAGLRALPLHGLKIDRSFVNRLPEDGDAVAITGAAIALAHALGLRAIAVGVENAVQLSLLERLGCDAVQGFHFARPMPAAELAAYARART